MRLTAKLAPVLLAAVIAASALGAGIASADPNGEPALPADPGHGYVPAAGHRGGIDGVVPMWAPPPPPPPVWAPWVPVVWNSDLPAWGVWWNGAFLRL